MAAASGVVDIHSVEMGDPAHPVVVLVSALGRRWTMWPTGLAHALVIAGYRVIRFDNRDVGLSTHLRGKARIGPIGRALAAGETPDVPYLLTAMADDTVGLLDRLGVERAHLVGASLGGRIAQLATVLHPHRVRTLTSVMSTTGAPQVGQPSPKGVLSLLRAPPPDREGAIAAGLQSRRLIATPGRFDEVGERASVAHDYDVAFDPAGPGRQLAAVRAMGDQTEALRTITTPTLVIHGTADEMVALTGGVATAQAIPGSQLVIVEGMGHDLVPAHWSDILDPLITHLALG